LIGKIKRLNIANVREEKYSILAVYKPILIVNKKKNNILLFKNYFLRKYD